MHDFNELSNQRSEHEARRPGRYATRRPAKRRNKRNKILLLGLLVIAVIAIVIFLHLSLKEIQN